jgi:hypothetical protein
MLSLLLALVLTLFDGSSVGAWRTGAGGPGQRYAETFVWDPVAKRALLIDGERNTDDGKAEGFRDDLWSYDPVSDKWTEIQVPKPRPTPRAYQAAAIDAVGRKLYLHGGFGADFKFKDDLWVLDLDKHTWKEITPSGDKPSIRDAHSLHFDEKKQALYLVGGLFDFASYKSLKDTWIYDIASSTWKRGPDAPANLFLHGAMFDPKERVVLTWGGSDAPDQVVHAWYVDKGTWGKVGAGPLNAMAMGSVFDPKSRKWYLACGSDGMNANGVLYAFDLDKKKTEKVASDPKVARGYTAACFDVETGELFMFGGTKGGFLGPCVPDTVLRFSTRK